MMGIIEPSSGVVFGSAGDTPQKPEQWIAVENGALMLAESANLLMIGGRARNEVAWTQWATALRDTSETAMKAARAKDAAAIETASDEIYQACRGCHKIYVPGAAVN
jgi:cytochrome c5